jgi:hypothetical protein
LPNLPLVVCPRYKFCNYMPTSNNKQGKKHINRIRVTIMLPSNSNWTLISRNKTMEKIGNSILYLVYSLILRLISKQLVSTAQTLTVENESSDEYHVKWLAENKTYEVSVVVLPNTIVNPLTMVVKLGDTFVANIAVAWVSCTCNFAGGAQQIGVKFLNKFYKRYWRWSSQNPRRSCGC